MKIIKDLPLGVLIMVLSFFILYWVNNLIGPKNWYELPIIIMLSIFYFKLNDFGYQLAFKGIEVDLESKK
jgi:hypothetical protein